MPFFETSGERWLASHSSKSGVSIARGFIEFFEPDVIVEATPGLADILGWRGGTASSGMPRLLTLDDFYTVDDRGAVQFGAGVDVVEVMAALYDAEFKFERRRKEPFALFESLPGDAYFDIVGGRYPLDDALKYLSVGYNDVFSPKLMPANSTTALNHLKDGLFGPLWVGRHDLEESVGHGFHDNAFYVFDSTDPGDVIDYWNFRLVESRVRPINVNWFSDLAPFLTDDIRRTYRPIPGNPFGTKFHSTIYFGSSISDERRSELLATHLSGIDRNAFATARDPLLWRPRGRGVNRSPGKVVAHSKPIQFDEEATTSESTRIPSPSPSFVNATRRYRDAHWMNVVVPGELFRGEGPAVVYPTNLWSPEFPHIALGERSRIGREGWILECSSTIGYSLVHLQTGREAIVDWLKMKGITAKPSEEGQIAAQVIKAAGGLLPSGMFADRATLKLLGAMAESRSEVNRDGRKVAKAVPDRTRHINTIQQHFKAREERSFGYWNQLQYFLDRSVFRAGLRVQCPICSYQNWMDLDELDYKPKCSRCLNEFVLSQAPDDLHKLDWFYRVVGPFAAPDYARGSYAVALTLRALAGRHETEMTWSTGLSLTELNCEVDFVAWHRADGLLRDERDEPLLVVGEAKSFGHNAIDDSSIASLRRIAERFPGAVLVVSTLREGHELTLGEIARLRQLALWGRHGRGQEGPFNPLIVLTGTELFAEHSIANAWKQADGHEMPAYVHFADLHELSALTLRRYVGLGSFWDKRAQGRSLEPIDGILSAIRTRGSSPPVRSSN